MGLISNSWLALSDAPFTPMRAADKRSRRFFGFTGVGSNFNVERAIEDFMPVEDVRLRDLTILMRRT